MNDKAVFEDLVDRAMQADGFLHMRPVIEKELLHHDILFILDKENFLSHLTFQGGTALRLCYGAERFSEDLYFAGGKNFQKSDLIKMKRCLEYYMGERYDLEVIVKEPKAIEIISENTGIVVNRWQLNVTTSPERKDLPKQKIKIEVINIPAYSREPHALQNHYDFLPDGYSDALIITESLDEIMADKLVSLVSCAKHIRHRDIWDLHWLKHRNATVNMSYVRKKINDYGEKKYLEKLNQFLKNAENIIHSKLFFDEMHRFIPSAAQERTLKQIKFLDFLTAEVKSLLENVNMHLK